MKLDIQQYEAVTSEEKNVLVIAGPGAGKTRVIVERAACLVEEKNISPYEIVLITFTRHAANEILERLIERVGNKAYHMTIGTFHATALKLLHRFGDVIGFKKAHSTVYGEFEEQYLLREVAKDMGIYNGKTWKPAKKVVDVVFAKYYQEGIEPSEDDLCYDLFKAFIARCRENNSYTFGSLLTGMKLLLPHIKKYLHWKHILLDEAHDTDKLQWELLNSIRELFDASFFCVTDLDQSIYGWRGAYPEYLLQHQSGFTIYKLETNYRSVPSIVEASERLISHNKERIPKEMKAVREDGMSRVIVQKNCDSEFLVNLFTEEWVSGEPVVILSRVHGLLEKIDRLMEEQKIPHTYIGKTTALTNTESFRKFHAFLKLICNPFDNFSFLLVKDILGIPSNEYHHIRITAAQEGKSHFQVWSESTDDNSLAKSFFDNASEWPIDQIIVNLSASEFNWPFDSYPSADFAMTWAEEHINGKVSDYLDWLATIDIQDEVKEENEGITLMTIHACKGLEFPVVIVVGCNEGIIPSKQAISSGDIESERRLMYVAMTRAQNQLILAVRPEQTEKDGRIYENLQSRFITELQGG
jgi:DNA helicase-2/ATP-dependent DNA helicase PcrA